MFDVGFTELLLISIVALVVIGPERLPVVAKTAGQWIGKLQRFVRGVKTDLASELEAGDLKKLIGDQRDQIDELRKIVTTAKDDFQSSTKDVVDGAKRGLSELESTAKEANGKIDEAIQSDKTSDSTIDESTISDSDNPGSSAVSKDLAKQDSAKQDLSTQKTSTADSKPAGKSDDSSNMDRTGTESGS